MSRQLRTLRRPSGRTAIELLATLALVVIAIATLDLINGKVPGLTSGRGGQPAGPALTPTPSNVVIIPSDSNVPGEILYVRAGNIWVQSGRSARQLTSSGADAMPSFSADGTWIY